MFVTNDDEIQYLISKEKNNALRYGKYHSDHEAYAVVKEEIEECESELDMVRLCFDKMWAYIKKDQDNTYNLKDIKRYSIRAIKELIQVCACCDKYLENEGESKNGTNW